MPFIVVDGMPYITIVPHFNPYDIDAITALHYNTATLSDINPHGGFAVRTKQGTKKFKVEYTSQIASAHLAKKTDVFSGDEFRSVLYKQFPDLYEDASIGNANTDWQEQIYRNAFSHQLHIGIAGTLGKTLPYYVSFGKNSQQGIVKTSGTEETTAMLNLSPVFFDQRLKLKLRINKSWKNTSFADWNVFSSAVFFNPTFPVYDPSASDGYSHYMLNGEIIDYAYKNPVALLDQSEIWSKENDLSIFAKLDYTFHFLPMFKVALAYSDVASKNKNKSAYTPTDNPFDGVLSEWEEAHNEKNYYGYLQFSPALGNTPFRVNAKAGYNIIKASHEESRTSYWEEKHTYKFGNLYLAFKDRYSVSANYLSEADSRLMADNRQTNSVNYMVAWNIANEKFLSSFGKLNRLELKAGAGTSYYYGHIESSFLPSNIFRKSWTNSPTYGGTINPDIEKERRDTKNIGMYWGAYGNRIYGNMVLYSNMNQGLVMALPVPTASDFSNYILTNFGDMENSGWEFSIGGKLIERKNISWSMNAFFSHSKSIFRNAGFDYEKLYGTIPDGIGSTIFILSDGEEPHSFFVNRQIYSPGGKPLEGLYEDVEGTITSDKRQVTNNSIPGYHLGINSSFAYKNFEMSFSGRMQTGNSVYNYIAATAYYNRLTSHGVNVLYNVPSSVQQTNFSAAQYYSSHYVEDASFFKMDYISVGYRLPKLYSTVSTKLSVIVQNAFTITQYSGQDPEQPYGMETFRYPTARTFSLKLNISL